MVGWVIPHVINPNTPDADKQLDKAETYEKHAIEDHPRDHQASDPDGRTIRHQDEMASEAHSGLGLVYFRGRISRTRPRS